MATLRIHKGRDGWSITERIELAKELLAAGFTAAEINGFSAAGLTADQMYEKLPSSTTDEIVEPAQSAAPTEGAPKTNLRSEVTEEEGFTPMEEAPTDKDEAVADTGAEKTEDATGLEPTNALADESSASGGLWGKITAAISFFNDSPTTTPVKTPDDLGVKVTETSPAANEDVSSTEDHSSDETKPTDNGDEDEAPVQNIVQLCPDLPWSDATRIKEIISAQTDLCVKGSEFINAFKLIHQCKNQQTTCQNTWDKVKNGTITVEESNNQDSGYKVTSSDPDGAEQLLIDMCDAFKPTDCTTYEDACSTLNCAEFEAIGGWNCI